MAALLQSTFAVRPQNMAFKASVANTTSLKAAVSAAILILEPQMGARKEGTLVAQGCTLCQFILYIHF